MLLDLQHDTSLLLRDFVREAGATVMPSSKDKKPTTAAAEQVTAPQIPSRPDLKTEAEFEAWAITFLEQEERSYLAKAGTRPSAALGLR